MKTLLYILFFAGLAFQVILAFFGILPLAPLGNGMALINEETYSYLYILVGIVTVLPSLIKRLPYGWMAAIAYGIVTLSAVWVVLYHSPFYENQGQLSFSVKLNDHSPITWYEGRSLYPPKISVVYTLCIYNVLMILLYFFRRKPAKGLGA